MTATLHGPPKLSIGIHVFTGDHFLKQLLLRLQKHTIDYIETTLSDHAYKDMTNELCIDDDGHDPRIGYYRNACNLGAHRHYNKVFALSRAALFKWAAHDDLYAPRFLEQ